MESQRKSGILLHPTSLPGRFGIGSMNQAAYDWVDFLERTKQSLWQVLPLGPTGYGDSPYQSFSTFAGNPYLISLEELVKLGLLDQSILDSAPEFPPTHVDYGAIYNWKLPILHQASAQLAGPGAKETHPELLADFEKFCSDNAEWLDDFALFMALKDEHDGAPWHQWEMPLRSREAGAIEEARKQFADDIHGHKVNQWLFFTQWSELKEYANERGIQIVGDIPIFVALDSADTWTNPSQFYLDEKYLPTVVAGVPPDYFSKTGQLWGNPLYRWKAMKADGYAWWLRRIRAALKLYDVVRVDHFRGFAGYWEVPADEKTAINGRWVRGPGEDFFNVVGAELGELPIIAEDLGEITPDVIALRDQFKLPGMKVLQFAFASDASDKFLPHNYNKTNFVVYSGTHDNDTSRGWYERSSTDEERDFFRRYTRTNGNDAAWTLIDTAFRSVADMAVVPLQDILNLGTEARMNLPGKADGNWTWRFVPHQLTGHIEWRLIETTTIYGRDPEVYAEKEAESGGQSSHGNKPIVLEEPPE